MRVYWLSDPLFNLFLREFADIRLIIIMINTLLAKGFVIFALLYVFSCAFSSSEDGFNGFTAAAK